MNSRALFILLGVLVLGGGYFAVQNLKTTVDIDDSATRIARSEDHDATDSDTVIDDGEPKVTAIDDRTQARRRPLADRSIRRGAGAAALEVTPATGTPAAPSSPIDAPPTDEEIHEENKAIADMANLFRSASEDVQLRMDAADKLGQIDSPETIKTALELLKNENDPRVQEALIEAMHGLDSQEQASEEIIKAMAELYPKTENPDVKIAVQDLMGDMATPTSAAGLREVIKSGQSDPSVQVNAAENLLRISRENASAVPKEESAAITQQLKDHYTKGTDPDFQRQVLMALSVEGKENLDFFKEALSNEENPENRQMLERLISVQSGQ